LRAALPRRSRLVFAEKARNAVFSPVILITSVLNGLLTGAVYALVALGLTLIYGVLHIINFAHGALLSMALFAAFFAFRLLGLDPYLAALLLAPVLFAFGYALQRFIISPASHGDDRNMLLVTLGLSVVIENLLLYAFRADTRTIEVPYAFQTIDLGFTFLPIPRVIGFGVVFAVALALWALMSLTDIGKAIRAVAKEKLGAQLSGIDVSHVYAMTFGLGTACVAVAACLLIPTYYVNPTVGDAFVLIAFTIVVLGGMGSVPGALIGGLLIGVVESLSGLFLGESLGQIGIFIIFIAVLLVRPTGLFGVKA
jgi:branched-chain amino acid transport system permease protein